MLKIIYSKRSQNSGVILGLEQLLTEPREILRVIGSSIILSVDCHKTA